MTTLVAEADKDDIPEDMGVMAILDSTGDTRIMWDPNQKDEVDAAKKQFDDLIGKGYQAFAVKKRGGAGEKVREFDPSAGKLILARPTVGG